MLDHIARYTLRDPSFTNHECIELSDVMIESSEEAAADYFLDMMGYR